jgi:hypothetical protein
MKSAVINKETTIVENVIMASPNDIWLDESTYLVLVPDNLPVDLDNTYDGINFICKDGNIVLPQEEITEEVIVEEVING